MTAVMQPSGSVTLVFTDIEGSTRLLDELGTDAYREALARHRQVVREACARYSGYEVDYEGDAFFFAFASATGAVSAVQEAMAALAKGPIRIRVGIHTGEPELDPPKYVGMDVHRAARIMSAAHGGQVVLTQSTRALVDERFPLTDLGEHRLKDIADAVRIFQLGEASFPPLKTISDTNLPRPTSSFVGREAELAEVVTRIEDGARLLTLTGPGGSGKTRLAIEAATSLVPEYKAGVFWVGLTSLRDPALVMETIAQTLGAKDGLAEHVGERELLLLLDNLEQVIEAAPELASLLERCPNLTLLVTSRELLRVRGEVEYPVPPLAEPEGVSLFCQRARLEPSGEIAELCARLDNLPLAVELAAARTKALSVSQTLERLSSRLDLFKGGRDADPRQQTLRATIEWSYDLLSEPERLLFRRLSVFDGGCRLDAAEEVCEADLDTLQSLIEKNLLRFSNERYWMLETIREYAAERLEGTSEKDGIMERLATQLVELAKEEGAPDFVGRQASAYERLAQEHPNVRAVISWAIERRRYQPVLELVAALWEVWSSRGPILEALSWVDTALVARGQTSDIVWARMLFGAGELRRFAGDLEGAVELKEELLELATRSERCDPLWIGATLADLSDIALQRGELERARGYAERSLAFRAENGMPAARALHSLGELALREGNLWRAEQLLKSAAEEYEQWGHEENFAATLESLGEVARQRGDDAQALERFNEALRRFAGLGDEGGVAECLKGLAAVSVAQGRTERAGRLWGAGQALQEAGGWHPWRQYELAELSEEARDAGSAMSLDEAVAFAISDVD